MSAVVDHRVEEALSERLEGAGPVLVVDPPPPIVEALIGTAVAMDDPPTVRLLADEGTLKDVFGDFLVASNAADLVERGTLSIGTAEVTPGNELLLTDDELTALIGIGADLVALTTDDADLVGSAYAHYSEVWEGADEYALRTPALSRVTETLGEEIGEEIEADFEAVLRSLETARGDGDGLDEVTISLLVAAKNEELLYDVSKWGEDVGIASKATFSRTKTALEEVGLIDTEKVPIDVGRPRLRLRFADERLRNATADELASVAQSLMA